MSAGTARIAPAGKYLSFRLGGQEYGLEILKVQEIDGVTDIERAPRAPEAVRGVIRLRGRTVPVVSLRRRLRLEPVPDDEKTCIIVAQVQRREGPLALGLVVDEVAEVLNLAPEQIEPAPSCGGGMDEADFITGMGRLGGRVVILLDIDTILEGGELDAVAAAVG